MRRRLLPLAAAAGLLVLPGCHEQWGTHSASGSATVGPDAGAAEDVRSAIPAIEAYNADHGSYAGMTVEALRARYDRALGDVRIVVATNAGYCVESTADGATYSFRGPAGPMAPVGCNDAPPAEVEEPPAPSYDPQTNLRIAIPAIEAWYADHGTYAGMTVRKLRRYDYTFPELEIVKATKTTYCIESTVADVVFSKNGPGAGIVAGGC